MQLIHWIGELSLLDIKSRAYTYSEQGYATDDEPQKDKYSREALAQLLILVESRVHARYVCATSNVEGINI